MCAGKKQQKQETVTVVTASTMQYLTQHPNTQKEGRCSEGLSVVNSCRETPGPIPNPEAKPAHADGTATGRLWESKSPPTPNNTNNKIQQRRGRHTTALFLAFYQPSQLVEAVGTTHIRVAPTASFCVYTHRSRPAHQPHNDGFNIQHNGKSETNPQPFLLPPLPSEGRLRGSLRL